MSFHIIQLPHQLLGKPNIFIGVNRFHAPFAAGGDKSEVFRCGRANRRDLRVFLVRPPGAGLLLLIGGGPGDVAAFGAFVEVGPNCPLLVSLP